MERVPPSVRSAEDASLSRCTGMARSPSPALVPPSFFKDVIIFFRKPSSGSMLSPAKRDKERQRFCFFFSFFFMPVLVVPWRILAGGFQRCLAIGRTCSWKSVAFAGNERGVPLLCLPRSLLGSCACMVTRSQGNVSEKEANLAFEGRRRDEVTLPACHVGWREPMHTHTYKKKFYEFPFFWRT